MVLGPPLRPGSVPSFPVGNAAAQDTAADSLPFD